MQKEKQDALNQCGSIDKMWEMLWEWSKQDIDLEMFQKLAEHISQRIEEQGQICSCCNKKQLNCTFSMWIWLCPDCRR